MPVVIIYYESRITLVTCLAKLFKMSYNIDNGVLYHFILRLERNLIYMTQEKMNRISELSRKQRSTGLTDEEKAEQKELREEYLADIRRNFRQTLESVEFTDKKIQ